MSSQQCLKVVFAGTPAFASTSLAALLASRHEVVGVYTQPDRPAGRGRKLKPSPVKTLALEHQLPVRQPARLGAHAVDSLRALGADVMVVAAYGLLLPPAVLELPTAGCINVHASLLPRWRGAAPIQQAILAGDTDTGVSIMQMDAGLDTGDVLLTRTIPIADDTAAGVHDRLAELGAAALLEVLDQIGTDRLTASPQDEALATYAPRLHKHEAWLDWNHSAVELWRKVRAFDPWPVACTLLHEERMRVWSATPIDATADAAPGVVVADSRTGIDVATRDGLLRITRLQLPGARPVSAADLINARGTLRGTQLGATATPTGTDKDDPGAAQV